MEIYTQKRSPIIRWIIVAIFALCFAADLMLILTKQIGFLDGYVFDAFQNIRDRFVTVIAKGITFCANTSTIAGICAVLLILPTRVRFGIPLSIAAVASGACHHLIKEIVQRARPDDVHHLVTATGFSFPSGHSNAGLVFFLFLMVLLRRYLIINDYRSVAYLLTVFFPILVVAIGASRVYLGVHYPSDVLGGWFLGGVLFIVFMTIYDKFYPIKYRINYAPPAWDAIQKRRAWRKPVNSGKELPLIEFPKNRSPWRRAILSEKRRQAEHGEMKPPERISADSQE
jgi:undecaprenyl-diphosphatase